MNKFESDRLRREGKQPLKRYDMGHGAEIIEQRGYTSHSVRREGDSMVRDSDLISLKTELQFATGKIRLVGHEPSPPSDKLLKKLSSELDREVDGSPGSLESAYQELFGKEGRYRYLS